MRRDEAYAIDMDRRDPLAVMRERFLIPPASAARGGVASGPPGGSSARGGGEAVYLVGNSLGLQPRSVRAAMERELEDWARLGVEGHFHASRPWYPYHEMLRGPLARLVGAHEHEVVAMNSLTVNLHLLMASFFRPTRERFKIVIEDAAFPSDSYAVQGQLAVAALGLGMDPALVVSHGVVRLSPREGERTLRTEDVLGVIDREHASIALVMLGGVNYYTGQFLAMEEITRHARSRGIVVGWDLAHAAGNVTLALHEWGVDFAAWCSYKYLNSGPGAVAGAFVHERHTRGRGGAAPEAGMRGAWDLPRLAGWWGNEPAERFRMSRDFVPAASADAWAVSNPPIFSLTPVVESLAIFDEAGMARLREKSVALTGYLEGLVREIAGVEVITPSDVGARGCQLSLLISRGARRVHEGLKDAGFVVDYREPDVIRVAPVPLYNTFHEAWRFAAALGGLMAG